MENYIVSQYDFYCSLFINIGQIGIYNIFIEIFYLSIVSRNLIRCKNLYQLQKSLRIEYVFIQSVKCFSHSGIRQSEVHADIPFSMKCFSALPKHSCLVAHFHSRYALFQVLLHDFSSHAIWWCCQNIPLLSPTCINIEKIFRYIASNKMSIVF